MRNKLPLGLKNPETSEPIYTDEEREFLTALDRYKTKFRRPFPTCREILLVLKELGYRKTEVNNYE